MKNKQLVIAIFVGVIIVGIAASSNAGWVPASNGEVPPGTLVSGHEANGEKLYECRAKYNGGVHPGKVRAEFKACNIGWGGKEISIPQYETYVIWQEDSNGNVPSSAVVGGHESDGTKLYICKGNYKGGVHSGKVRSAFKGCNIGWGGLEVKVNPYQVLIK
ncbi:MAG: DUF3421 domain-containing protein [Candidatus Electrothrix sp. AX2]|nr:DUF3421 domain-containing protein [Candidatus Electrothrix gigas]